MGITISGVVDVITTYYLQIFLAGTVSGIGILIKRFQTNKCDNELLKEGMMSLLHDRIMERGKILLGQVIITLDDLEEFKELYIPYKKLGGNGTGQKMFEMIETKCINDMNKMNPAP